MKRYNTRSTRIIGNDPAKILESAKKMQGAVIAVDTDMIEDPAGEWVRYKDIPKAGFEIEYLSEQALLTLLIDKTIEHTQAYDKPSRVEIRAKCREIQDELLNRYKKLVDLTSGAVKKGY